jgi:cold shock CspA family protein
LPTGEITGLTSETFLGVIREHVTGEDIFFHSAVLVGATFDRLSRGQIVEFDRQPYRKSPSKGRAINVRVHREPTNHTTDAGGSQ